MRSLSILSPTTNQILNRAGLGHGRVKWIFRQICESLLVTIVFRHSFGWFSLRRRQSNPLVYTVCVLVHDILFQIPLIRKDIYSLFWLVKTIVGPNTRQKQSNQKRLYISMRLSGIWNKISCTNTQTVKTAVWHKQTGCSAG